MRLMGCGMIFLCGIMAGILRRYKLTEDVKSWQELLHFFQLIREELENSLKPCEEILADIESQCANCRFLQEYKQAQGSLRQRLLHSAQKLEGNQQILALRFAQRFGTASVEIQLECLAVLERSCQRELEQSIQLAEREGSLSLNLGTLAGAAIAILLI